MDEVKRGKGQPRKEPTKTVAFRVRESVADEISSKMVALIEQVYKANGLVFKYRGGKR